MAKYDPTITKILEKVMEEEGLSKYQIEDVYLSIFKGAKTFIQLPACPRVFLANFGKFYVPLKKINRSIYITLDKWRKGYITREEAVERISYFWPVRKRLLEEFYSRKHKTSKKRKTYDMAEKCKPWDKESFVKRQAQRKYGKLDQTSRSDSSRGPEQAEKSNQSHRGQTQAGRDASKEAD